MEPAKCDKGGHYDKLKTQPILVMKDNMSHDEFMGFLWGNAIKYIMRWKNKDGLKDLSKAQVYLKWMIEFMETGDIVVD